MKVHHIGNKTSVNHSQGKTTELEIKKSQNLNDIGKGH